MNPKTQEVETAWIAHQQQLLSFIRSRVETTEDAEDILNDVFAKLLKVTQDNVIPDSIASWLYHVTKNSIVDYYRGKKMFEQLPDDISEKLENNSAIKLLSKCMLPMIQALPETYQHPLILSEIEGNKYKEVALELGLSVSAVKSRILRGREKLQKSMVSCCTIYRNHKGETVDYEQKQNSACTNCSD